MKKFINIIISIKSTLVLLVIFAVSLAIATFVEDKYDTATARHFIYNAVWFEVVLALLALNFIGNIKRYNLLRKEKFSILLFHLAFIVLIIGAGVTRYVGFEGSMHIREGQSTNVMFTSEPYLQIISDNNVTSEANEKPLVWSSQINSDSHLKYETKDKGTVTIDFNKYVKNAVQQIAKNANGGTDIIELSVLGRMGKEIFYLKSGEIHQLKSFSIAFNNNSDKNAFNIFNKDNKLFFKSPFNVLRNQMMENKIDSISKDSVSQFNEQCLYNVNGVMLVFVAFYKNSDIQIVSETSDAQKNPDALVLDLTYNGKKQQVSIFGGQGFINDFQDFYINGLHLKMTYGEKAIELPFYLRLNKFVLDRYPGSMSPSSFESKVTLIDEKNNINDDHRIYMNHVLNYKGYRFFQSSYDMDEKGTVLSVNHDAVGTWISYFGYFLLTVGFIFALMSKNSRFYVLRKKISEIRSIRKQAVAVIAIMLAFTFNSFAQSSVQKPVSAEHADKFGHLIVQTFDGRFEPMHTLAVDVMHKISRKDNFNFPEKGKMNDMQVFMDMFINMDFWKTQKMIYIREKSVRDILGINDKYAAFDDFFTPESKYKLADYAEKAFRKKPAEQNTFDKEIIKVDERVNVCIDVFKGKYFKIFPLKDSPDHKWLSWYDTLAVMPITGELAIINSDLQIKNFSYANILRTYFTELIASVNSGDYSKPDKILGYIDNIQRQLTPTNMLPSKTMVDYEIYYNKAKIFETLRNIYGILSLFLLLLAFIDNLKTKKNKILTYSLNFFIILLGAAFIYHTYGMGIRWYLTGHAPWSNGYEALLLVAWGSLLAGFCFVRNSKITLAATALLAFSMLMTAGHSSYDPQLTNLQPVLKSYWLIIHVAVITISYGFLGLGFFLGLINIFIYLFKTKKNNHKLDLIIKELSYINEMNLIIGLMMATIGTFLGGIWASESWGRYWGWDAKETWALIIVIAYSVILHMRLIPKLRSTFAFNVASIVGFGSVLMTFIGVNYYLSKGMHSYAQGETPVFPIWAWIMILSLILLIIIAAFREKALNPKPDQTEE